MKRLRMAAGVVCLSACVFAQGNGAGNGNGNTEGAGANGKVIHETKDAHGANGNSSTNLPTTYHGGPVLTSGTNVYYIWYGDWSNDTAPTILTNLAQTIGGSPYFNINTTYYNGSGVHVRNLVTYKGASTDKYSRGGTSTALSDSDIQTIVTTAINGGLPADPNAVYFVLTSKDVKKSGFCTSYCGWHTRATINGVDIKYSFVGNAATQCLSSCAAQSTSPNGNPGADGMASVIAHELEEATTDPDLNAWYDKRGAENADKCAWTFGTTSSASNGSKYNMTLGSTQYLIQQNWVNQNGTSGYCALKY